MLIAYTLSPIDFLPEMLLGPIGLIDDGMATLAIVRGFANLMVDFIRSEDARHEH